MIYFQRNTNIYNNSNNKILSKCTKKFDSKDIKV